jgi:acyl-CoA thioester hydrolase
LYIAETQIRVRYADTDQMGVVYYGNYATYYETGRTEAIRQLGFTYKDIEKAGIIMPVVELHSKFLRPALYDDLITVKTIIKTFPADHQIEFHQEVYNEKKKLLNTGSVILYFLEAVTMKKTTVPKALADKLSEFFI